MCVQGCEAINCVCAGHCVCAWAMRPLCVCRTLCVQGCETIVCVQGYETIVCVQGIVCVQDIVCAGL